MREQTGKSEGLEHDEVKGHLPYSSCYKENKLYSQTLKTATGPISASSHSHPHTHGGHPLVWVRWGPASDGPPLEPAAKVRTAQGTAARSLGPSRAPPAVPPASSSPTLPLRAARRDQGADSSSCGPELRQPRMDRSFCCGRSSKLEKKGPMYLKLSITFSQLNVSQDSVCFLKTQKHLSRQAGSAE